MRQGQATPGGGHGAFAFCRSLSARTPPDMCWSLVTTICTKNLLSVGVPGWMKLQAAVLRSMCGIRAQRQAEMRRWMHVAPPPLRSSAHGRKALSCDHVVTCSIRMRLPTRRFAIAQLGSGAALLGANRDALRCLKGSLHLEAAGGIDRSLWGIRAGRLESLPRDNRTSTVHVAASTTSGEICIQVSVARAPCCLVGFLLAG